MPQAKSNSISPAPSKIGDAKRRLLHVARRQLGLSDEDYRAIMAVNAGVGSSSDLDQRGFTAVMSCFENLGFRSTSPRRPLPLRAGMASPGQTSLMRQLWADCTNHEGSDATLGKWLERQFKVSSIRFVTAELAPKVVAALTAMRSKRGRASD